MVNIGVLYRYTWQGQPRAMHARLLGDVVTVNHADPVTCVHIEPAGEYLFTEGQLEGPGPLSQTRREAIAELLARSIASMLAISDLA